MQRVVIIGASHAGVAVADWLRRLDWPDEIDLICEQPHLPYQRPPLSKAADLLDQPPERWALKPANYYAEKAVTLHLGARATSLDPDRRLVTLADGRDIPYSHLILATGATPRELPGRNATHSALFSLRSFDDARRLRNTMANSRSMAVIGGGLIGLELAALAAASGKSVTVIEAASRIMARVAPPHIAEMAARRHERNGIAFLYGRSITEIAGGDTACRLSLSDGSALDADIVLVAIGAVPNTELAERAGLAVANGICVDHAGRTSDPQIFAIGDCSAWPHGATAIRFEGVQPAVEQARLVAHAIMEAPASPPPTPRFWSHQGAMQLHMSGLMTSDTEYRHIPLTAPDASMVLGSRAGLMSSCFAIDAPRDFNKATGMIGRPVNEVIAHFSPLSPQGVDADQFMA